MGAPVLYILKAQLKSAILAFSNAISLRFLADFDIFIWISQPRIFLFFPFMSLQIITPAISGSRVQSQNPADKLQDL
ncbi:hypothetical protein AB205_0062340 [Aquarana catesbeiana]|uniref:Uncharacterized protein n=1 Tax=Aquarana catesbeiana TaxID=8400 RepID=A0A2G9S7Y4_AQUCT|nr:hypothetical protein AB205_0062340 [Aquarana catesbeiana]PIO35562.1 hypothetical protein AB205_0062340 [Aquarana catesbeiana]